MRPVQRIALLGLVIPSPPKPLGTYVGAVQTGNLLYLSGCLPLENDELRFRGRIGNELTVAEGRTAVRLATLNAIALASTHLGTLDKVLRVVKLQVALRTASAFEDHASVVDAASEFLVTIFGAEGIGTRSIYGALTLPKGACAVVDLTLSIREVEAARVTAPIIASTRRAGEAEQPRPIVARRHH